MTDIRDKIIDIVKREFLGPDPNPDLIQSNGEEILRIVNPRGKYSMGILFPQGVKVESSDDDAEIQYKEINEDNNIIEDIDAFDKIEKAKNSNSINDIEEELLNLSNAYRQSAISISTNLNINHIDKLEVNIKAGTYFKLKYKDENSEKTYIRYYREPIDYSFVVKNQEMPLKLNESKSFPVYYKEKPIHLEFLITNRGVVSNNTYLYTFTLLNKKVVNKKTFSDEDCFYQVEFTIKNENGFEPFINADRIKVNDYQQKINDLLYRNIKSYAIGHGCSVEWFEENHRVNKIKTTFIPSYEVKPIVTRFIEDLNLSMLSMSKIENKDEIISNLNLLCDKYEEWIKNLELQKKSLSKEYIEVAEINIKNCYDNLQRMRRGIYLLKEKEIVLKAFCYTNEAMLLQQLHYNLPLNKWIKNKNSWSLEKDQILPVLENKSTWISDKYGNWRPFQIAFILLNIESMYDPNSKDRGIVDLIWFPTGGGKTEAYLGLSAFTIFLRRLKNPNNSGTTILMRYTLRLLTTQQYDRASSLICACEYIREKNKTELGNDRITIGLWVGESLTPNKMEDAIRSYENLSQGKADNNPFIILKCPWCGAQFGPVRSNKTSNKIWGYRKINSPKKIIFQCNNEKCYFSDRDHPLPIYIIDSEIYNNPPTLLIGTVDKFAMIPFRKESKSIFAIGTNNTPPELIIQDELHLISGPLGSMVGHYEVLINELCRNNDDNSLPKIIASTATISRAKEQCNALYGCGIDNVNQFPPSGIDYGDSFFAYQDKDAKGRKYVGIYAPASASYALSVIRLFATLLYAGKAIDVKKEEDRDSYWTVLGYFNTLKELGQTVTWIHSDISEYLKGIYDRKEINRPSERGKIVRRNIYKYEELTSRIENSKIPEVLQNLSIKYKRYDNIDYADRPIDLCLSSNMISVGVDISRLGLMVVNGQPKMTSEYIQATSRVGRSEYPGLVFVLYNPYRARDKSFYEQFQSYHSKLYYYVEPTSVTPFSSPVRSRALHAILVGFSRLLQGDGEVPNLPDKEFIAKINDIILNRVNIVDDSEKENTLNMLNRLYKQWKSWKPAKYSTLTPREFNPPLIYPDGMVKNSNWADLGWKTPTSMRNVELSCNIKQLRNYGDWDEDHE